MADTLRNGIVINEILADPNTSATSGFDTNGDGNFDNQDEFVELLNISNSAIDIGGLQLWDPANGNWFTFPSGTLLQPGAHAMVMTGSESVPLPGGPNDLFFYANRNSPLINNTGDNVIVFDPDSDGDGDDDSDGHEYISATFNGNTLLDPTTISGFSSTAIQSGSGEDFGSDNDGSSIQRMPDGADTFSNDTTPTPGTTNVCFTNGTMFETQMGSVAIEDLMPGDYLHTYDGRKVAIKWIWAKSWATHDLRQNPKLWPVEIQKDAFGNGFPERNIRVSQHHRVMVRSKIVERMFGHSDVLVPAKDLLDLDGVALVPEPSNLTYYHILLASHEVLLVEGIPAESLYLGPETLKSLDPEALEEICTIFHITPEELHDIDFRSAKHIVSGKRARKLAQRHAKNAQPICRGFLSQ